MSTNEYGPPTGTRVFCDEAAAGGITPRWEVRRVSSRAKLWLGIAIAVVVVVIIIVAITAGGGGDGGGGGGGY
jgi:hypothetical protein